MGAAARWCRRAGAVGDPGGHGVREETEVLKEIQSSLIGNAVCAAELATAVSPSLG
jgi:hypothetical protein